MFQTETGSGLYLLPSNPFFKSPPVVLNVKVSSRQGINPSTGSKQRGQVYFITRFGEMGKSALPQELQDRTSQPIAATGNYISSGIRTQKLYSRSGNFAQSKFPSELTGDRYPQLFPDVPERAWLAAWLEQRHPERYFGGGDAGSCREAGAAIIAFSAEVWDRAHLLVTGRCR